MKNIPKNLTTINNKPNLDPATESLVMPPQFQAPAPTQVPMAPGVAQPPQEIAPSQNQIDIEQELSQRAMQEQMDLSREAYAQQQADTLFSLEKEDRDRQKAQNLQLGLQNEMISIQKQLTDVNKKQIDPNRFWSNAATWQKVLAGISIALGGLGARSTGGKNSALEIINKAVDDDIKAQESNISNEFRTVSGKAALAQLKMQSIKDYLQSLDSKTTDNLKKAQLATMLNAIDQQQLEREKQRVMSRSIQEGNKLDISMLDAKDQEKALVLNDGSVYVASNKPALKAIGDRLGETDNAIRVTNELVSRLGQVAKGRFTTAGQLTDRESAKQITALAQQLVGAMRLPWFGGGQFSDTEQRLATKALGNVGDLFQDTAASKENLKNIKEMIKESMRSSLIRYSKYGSDQFRNPNESNIQFILEKAKKSGVKDFGRLRAIQYLRETGKYKADPLDTMVGL